MSLGKVTFVSEDDINGNVAMTVVKEVGTEPYRLMTVHVPGVLFMSDDTDMYFIQLERPDGSLWYSSAKEDEDLILTIIGLLQSKMLVPEFVATARPE